jgi:hypothetical protein
MESEWTKLARKLAEGARRKAAEEQRRIDAIIASRKDTQSQQPQSN